MSSVIDLRGKRAGRKPSPGQQMLFSPRDPSEQKRPLPLRAKRRRMFALKVLAVLILLALVAWGISFATYLPQFTIQSVKVEGAQAVPTDLIEKYAWTILDNGSYHYLSRSNIFFYPRAVLEHAVESYFPRIASAQVYRSDYLSTGIIIHVQERLPFALWCEPVASTTQASSTAQCYDMDESGFIFAEAAPGSGVPSSPYIFHGDLSSATTSASSTPALRENPIGETFATAHLPGMLVLLRLLGQSGFTPQGATIESTRDLSIPLAEGFLLKVSFGSDADTLVKNLQLVLSSDALQGKESELEYVDLRFGDRVYYKLKGQDQTAVQ